MWGGRSFQGRVSKDRTRKSRPFSLFVVGTFIVVLKPSCDIFILKGLKSVIKNRARKRKKEDSSSFPFFSISSACWFESTCQSVDNENTTKIQVLLYG